MSMTKSNSLLPYPQRFLAAAQYAGFGGSQTSPDAPISKFKNENALLLYGLFQQATVGPCNIPKPRSWNPIENSKWMSWDGLEKMPSTEAMRLFVKILEEEDPKWYSKLPLLPHEEAVDKKESLEATPNHEVFLSGSSEKVDENNVTSEIEDKDILKEGLASISTYDEWVTLPVSGKRPPPRYEHGAAILHNKMYIFGGNHNGHYLNDTQVLDLKTLAWTKLDTKFASDSDQTVTPSCAGHSLLPWGNKLFAIAGHTKNLSDVVIVLSFDTKSCTWSFLNTFGKAPIARGGQSVTLVGSRLVMFGGEDSKRSLLNDLNILDLETMTWDAVETLGVPPSPRSDHAAAVHRERYLVIFGGGSHSTCFNDINVLDLQSMEWSQPKVNGCTPMPRAGHAGITIGEHWYIVGGGDNKSGVPATVVLKMSTLEWSVLTTVSEGVPLASEGLSVSLSAYNGENFLVAFGGYNGRYNNEIHILKLRHDVSQLKTQNILESGKSDPVIPTSNGVGDVDLMYSTEESKFREISIDSSQPDSMQHRGNEMRDTILESLKLEKNNMEAALSSEQSFNFKLKQELMEARTTTAELTEELRSVRGQLAAEQSRCFRLEVDVAELKQKLQQMEALQKELELLQRQKAASDQATDNAVRRQNSGGVWGWIAGTPQSQNSI